MLLMSLINSKELKINSIEFFEGALSRGAKAFKLDNNIKYDYDSDYHEILIFNNNYTVSLFDHTLVFEDYNLKNKYKIELDYRHIGYLYVSEK